MSTRNNPHAATWAAFIEQTPDHQLVAIHDDGLYRHLRVQIPGTRLWSWDVVTWPGHLATAGDVADGFTFRRTEDMLSFFFVPDHLRTYYSDGAPSIDVRYWAEKLTGNRSHSVKAYDSELFLQQVREALEENEDIGLEAQQLRERQLALLERVRTLSHRGVGENPAPTVQEQLTKYWADQLSQQQLFAQNGLTQTEMDQLAQEFDVDENGEPNDLDLFALEWAPVAQIPPQEHREEILRSAELHADTEYEAHTWLAENEKHVGSDTFEWDLREYDFHFVLACYCIDKTVQLYRQHRAELQRELKVA